MSVNILLLTHAQVGDMLIEALRSIMGPLPLTIQSLCVQSNETADEVQQHLNEVLNDPKQPWLILTDLFGATPCNLVKKFCDKHDVELVSGVNLPMLIRVMNYPQLGLSALAEKALAGGKDGVKHAKQTCHH